MTMDIQLARVDSRLLHGQVATYWTKKVKPDRILVVSDSAANNPLRKALIAQVAPQGVKANVISVAKMLSIYNDERFAAVKVLLITETVADMLKLVQGGLDLTTVGINVGNLSYDDGMQMITDSIAVNEQIATEMFQLVNDYHLTITAQKIPSDKPKLIPELLAKNNFKETDKGIN